MKYGAWCLAVLSAALVAMARFGCLAQQPSSETSVPPTAGRGGNSRTVLFSQAHVKPVAPSLDTLVAQMLQAANRNAAHFHRYTLTREYELFVRDRDSARTEVIANITFIPRDTRNYTVRRTEGSAIGEMIVRRVLGREAAIAKGRGSSDITSDNYRFRLFGEEVVAGHRCYLLQLMPKRRDPNLLRGTAWVDADTYLIRRIEGQPEKNPSWWERDVCVDLIFADLGGMWLPTSSQYSANVRLLGASVMIARDLSYGDLRPAVAAPSFSEDSEGRGRLRASYSCPTP